MASANQKNAVLERWSVTCAARGSEPAVLSPGGESLRNFCDIESEAQRLAGDLERFAPGEIIAMQIGNSASTPALLLAAFRRKLIPLPLGRHMEKMELDAALTALGVAGMVQQTEQGLQFAHGNGALHRWCDEPPDFLKLTSGTTAVPRAIRFRAQQLVADCDNICATMGLNADDLNFGVIPFSHSYGFSNLITPLLCRGVALVASEDRMPRAILHDLARSGATIFPGMPVFFAKLAELEKVPALPRLRLCISAGAPLTAKIARDFSAKFGLKIHTFYGSSECGGIGYDASEALDYEEDFAGLPLQNVVVTPVDFEEPTRIEVRSDAVGDGYFPEEDPDVLGGGKFVPADLVRISPRGLRIVGRESDMINVAGRKLNPAEVEARLADFAGVKQIVVFGIPSKLRNEEAVACVAGEVDERELLQFARTVLTGWQVPKAVWRVDEIPVNERGKISRRDLAQLFLSNSSH